MALAKPIADALQRVQSGDVAAGEATLRQLQREPQFSFSLIKIVSDESAPPPLRLAAAVLFKNFLREQWAPAEGEASLIPEADRVGIKRNLVGLMLNSAGQVLEVLSAAITTISKHDFPARWPDLISELAARLDTKDFRVICGVLQTASAVMERYEWEFESNELNTEILHVVETLPPALTSVTIMTRELLLQGQGDPVVLLRALELGVRCFYLLNVQDLTPFFDNEAVLDVWMETLSKLLSYRNASVRARTPEEAGPLELVHAGVLKAITLFAKKYEPEFGKYAGRFAPLVWQLATSLGEETRYDGVVYASITFLQTLARLGSLKDMFNDESRMRALCERVIIPQLKLRESDEECFESDPIEYIRRDLEASDRETRRRGTVEFVEGLMEHFEQQITNLLKQYVGRMLQDYRAEPDAKWQLKDAAMYAVLALSAKSIGRDGAAKEVNRYINVVDFVQHEVLPELQKDLDRVPVLHADAIKFVCVFRSLLPPPAIPVILPLLVRHLESDLVVVHTYAAHAIERLLFRDSKTEPRVPREMLRPHLARLLQLLFACLNKPDSAENEYVVRAIMRVCGAAQEDMVPLLRPVVGSLTGIVKRVALRSTNPNFNYMLFETLAVLVRSLGAAHPDSLATFESALFPTFSEILQSGNQDLMPYVLQMLALLLSRHASVPDHYRGLFDLAISPPMYENHGNIPAIVTLLRAFLAKGEKAAAFIKERLTGALGAFQKILSVRRQVSQAVELIVAMLHYLPLPLYRDHLPEVCRLFFVRLSGDKSPYTFRQIVSFFSHFVLKHGFNALVQVCERIGPNVLPDFMGRMWLPRINNVVGYDARCLAAVALVNACTQSSAMAEGPFQPLWPRALEAAVVLLEKKEEDDGDNTEAELQDRAETGGSTGFAKLPSAALPQPDPLAEVRDPRAFIGAAVGRFLETRPQMAAAMQTLSDEAQKALMGFGAGGGGAVAGVQ